MDWFMHDSYFEETYTVKATWEVIDDNDEITTDDDGIRATISDGPMGKELRVRGLIKIGQAYVFRPEEYEDPYIRSLVIQETKEKVREKIREITTTPSQESAH